LIFGASRCARALRALRLRRAIRSITRSLRGAWFRYYPSRFARKCYFIYLFYNSQFMAWRKLDAGKETMFLSDATDYTTAQRDLAVVVQRMIDNKTADAATDAEALLFYTNATNGFINIKWYNPETEKTVGNLGYYLELKTLWEISLEHNDGAFFFDNQTHIAICCTYEDFMDDYGDCDFDVFTSNEMDSTPEELYI
jgi:hypothetical protein